jgi:F-type H+-transporting ATPase subunit b
MNVRLGIAALGAALLLSSPAFSIEDPVPHAAPGAAAQGDQQAAGHAAEGHAADGHAGDAAGHAEHKPSVFEGGIGNAIITLIIFGVVLYVLGQKAWPQLLKVLNEREQQIRGALEDAKRERIAAERLLADYKRQIDKAREEATSIVDEGRRDAETVRKRIQEEARLEAGEMVDRAKREINLARDAAVKELYDRTVDLATQMASGIIKKTLSPEDHRALAADTLERMKASEAAKRN